MKKLSLNTWLLIGLAVGFVLGLVLNLAEVGETGVRISELSFGDDPFIELANSESSATDIGAHRLEFDFPDGAVFVPVPAGTAIEPRSLLVVPTRGTGRPPVRLLELPETVRGKWPTTVRLVKISRTVDEQGKETLRTTVVDRVSIQTRRPYAGKPPPKGWGAPLALEGDDVSVYRRSFIDSASASDWKTAAEATPGTLRPDQTWARSFISNTATRLLRELLRLLGETIFIGLLKMVIIPLIITSVVTGIAGIGETSRVGALGARTVVYYLSTTFAACALGIVLVNIIGPGVGFPLKGVAVPENFAGEGGGFLDAVLQILRELIPTNVFAAMADMKILPLIVFSILFGVILLQMGEQGRAMQDLFRTLNEMMMRLTKLVMKLGPIGVLALTAELVWIRIEIPDLIYLGKYLATVLLGLAIHGAIVLPLVLRIFGRVNPWTYCKQVSPALTTAFSTDSSSATLPVTMEVTRNRAGVPQNVGSFVLPLGATVNMDGTALYESVAAIFIAQAYLGHDLELGQQVVVFLTATLAAVGAAGIPSAGIVMMIIVLRALNLPAEGVALVLAVDRIVDQCRTTVNVWGDTIGAAIITRYEGQELRPPNPGGAGGPEAAAEGAPDGPAATTK